MIIVHHHHHHHRSAIFVQTWSRSAGIADNEFAGGKSKWAHFEHAVFSDGTIDEASGDCVKCDTVFIAAGFADE